MTPPRPGDIVWVNVDKLRIAVVFHVKQDGRILLCIPGTGTDRDGNPRVTVLKSSQDGCALFLTKDTHFYATDLQAATVASVDRVVGRCPFTLWDALDELLDEHPGQKKWNEKRKAGGLP